MAKVEVKKWLANEKHIPVHMVGTIDRESAKAIYFIGHGDVSESVYCHVCGRHLTNPVSRVVGIGPVCCGKFGIPRPNYSNAVELAKQLKENMKFEGWLPKSQITINLKDGE